MTLLEEIKHEGPNGSHTCLVFDVMGPSVASMIALIELLPINQPKFSERARYPAWMAKSMLRQALLGLHYLHQNGIIHGDFQPGNLLFSDQPLNEFVKIDPVFRVKISDLGGGLWPSLHRRQCQQQTSILCFKPTREARHSVWTPYSQSDP